MTLQDIYKKTKAWMFEKPSSNIYDPYIVEIANKVLAETYEENNMLRMFKGKLPFVDGVASHQVEELANELDYEDEYLLDVIPKGIDANFLMDDDLSKMSIYQTEYNNARVMHQVLLSQDVIDRLTEEANANP
jgi:hypothetical protein